MELVSTLGLTRGETTRRLIPPPSAPDDPSAAADPSAAGSPDSPETPDPFDAYVEEDDCHGGEIPTWLTATSSRLRVLADASLELARVLRLLSRPSDALATATLAARNLEAVGGGSPPGIPPDGARATAARDAAREANADALCARLRAEAMEALLDLDRVDQARSHADAAEMDADAAGDVDAARHAAFVRARADAKRGAVDAALAAYAALLLDMAESPRDVAAPAPERSFRASAAEIRETLDAARSILRRGDARVGRRRRRRSRARDPSRTGRRARAPRRASKRA